MANIVNNCSYVDENHVVCGAKINDNENYCRYHRRRRRVAIKRPYRRSRPINLRRILNRLEKLEKKINEVYDEFIKRK